MNQQDEFSEIITFYSYKGGTGRTMALANMAWILASSGKSVLVVDWDLEAPGLHRYFHPFLLDKEMNYTTGVLDMLWDFALAALDTEADNSVGWHKPYADVLKHAVSLRWKFPQGGNIDILGAGKQDKSFGQRVNSFDWHAFYDRLGGGAFIESMKEHMRREYDYVLVDSRTGLSDSSGICTIQLPDTLVACFTMSTQSIAGCASVVDSIMHQRIENPLRVLPVPMRVESGETDRLEESRDWAQWRFRKVFRDISRSTAEEYWGEVEVPYKSLYAYEEMIAPIGDRPHQEDTLLSAFERLTAQVTRGEVRKCAPLSPKERSSLRRAYRQRPSARAKYDFFLSYVREDRRWAEWISWELSRAGYRVSPDSSVASLEEMGSLYRDAQSESAKVIALLSPDFFKSSWAAVEYLFARNNSVDDSYGSQVLPIKVSQFSLPVSVSSLAVLNISGQPEEEARARLIDALLTFHGSPKSGPDSRLEQSRRVRFPDAIPENWNVPARVTHFVGREDELLLMARHFRESNQIFVISGMAGVGKTALAVEFAHRMRGSYNAVWYADTPDSASADTSAYRVASALSAYAGVNDADNQWLELLSSADSRVLLIIDGLDELEVTENLMTTLSGYHVVAVCRSAPRGHAYGIELPGFSNAEAVALFRRYVPDITEPAAEQIAARLGYLPLAIQIAANHLSVSASNVADFLALLDSRMDEVVLRAAGESGRSLVSRLNQTFSDLTSRSPAAADLLSLVAMVAPNSLPLGLLSRDPSILPSPLSSAVSDDTLLADVVSALTRRSIAEFQSGHVKVHPVLAAVVRSRLTRDEQEHLSGQLTRVLVANDPGDPSDPASWPTYRSLMPLVNSIHWSIDRGFRELLLGLCLFHLVAGNPLAAKDLADRVARRFEVLLGSVHENTLDGLHIVALCDLELGNVSQAVAVLEQVTLAREQLLGENHPATLASMNNLAAAFAAEHRWSDAIRLHELIQERRLADLGPDHPDTLVSRGNLASSLYGAGRVSDAEEMEQSVLQKRMELFGLKHPASLASAENLAFIQERLGRYEDALTLLMTVRAGRTDVLGSQHPDSLKGGANIFLLLRKMGRHEEAESLALSIVDDLRNILGPEHQATQEVSRYLKSRN